MKTTTKIIFLLLSILFCISSASATLNITMLDRGTNFITWEWTSPSDVSEMYIDGQLMCGYESTDPTISIVDLLSNSCHNLTLFTDIGNNSNVACTMSSNATRGGGETVGNVGMNNDAIMYGLVGAACGAVVLMGFFMRRRRG
jgi:hypothetical protein